MEKLTVSEVIDLLRAEGSGQLADCFSWYAILHAQVCAHVCMCDNYMLSQRITLTELHWLRYLKIQALNTFNRAKDAH